MNNSNSDMSSNVLDRRKKLTLKQRVIIQRRNQILEYLGKGMSSYSKISRALSVSDSTVQRDIEYMTIKAQDNIETFTHKRIPFELEDGDTGQ